MNLILFCNEYLLFKKQKNLLSKKSIEKLNTIRSKTSPALLRLIFMTLMPLIFGAGCIFAQQPFAQKDSINLSSGSNVKSVDLNTTKKITFNHFAGIDNSKKATDTAQLYFYPGGKTFSAGPSTDGGGVTCPVTVGSITGNTTINTCGAITNTTQLVLSGFSGTIQWESSTDNNNYTSISGATGTSYTAVNITNTTYYRTVVTNGSCIGWTPPVTIIVNNAPVASVGIISVVGSNTVCSGNSITLNLSSYTGNIQWQSSTDNTIFSNISGATGISYTAANITTATYYRAVVTSGACASATSDPFSISVAAPTTIATNLVNPAAICLGGPAPQLSVTATGSGLIYTWYSEVNGIPNILVGENNSTYTPPVNIAGTYYYYVVVGGNCGNVTSSTAIVQVNPAVSAGTIAGAGTVCSSGNSTTLNLSGYTGTIQWQSSIDNINYTNISGATSISYAATNITTATYFRTVVTSGTCGSATSDPFTISVTSPTVITTDLVNPAAICLHGTAPQLSVTATGIGLTYSWYSIVNGISTILTGEISSTYTPPVNIAGTYNYYVIVGGNCGNVTSSTAIVIVNLPASVATVTGIGSNTVCSGNSTTINLSSYSGNIQWQSSTDNTIFSNISGATGISYTATNITTAAYYRAVVTSSGCGSATSDLFTISVTTPTVITTDLVNPAAVCMGGTATPLSVTATGNGLTYNWYSIVNGIPNILAGENSSTYNPPVNIAGTYYYYVVVGGNCGNVLTSSTATVAVSPAAIAGSITLVGANHLCSNTTNTLLTLAGNIGTIQWQSSIDGVTYIDISGAINNKYTTTNIITTTYYRALVTSGVCGNDISGIITILAPPVITTDVTSPTAVCVGGTAPQLSVAAMGDIFSYQWYSLVALGGSPFIIDGATSSSYTPPISSAGTYYYYVQVNNACDPLKSSIATVVVSPAAIAGTITGGSAAPVCSSSNTTLTLTGNTGTIQWQSSVDNSKFTDIFGEINNTYTTTNITTITYYRAVVTSGTCGSVISDTAILTASVPVFITANVTSLATVCLGGTAPQLSVTATGDVLSYQWYSLVALGGSPFIIGGAISSSYIPTVSLAGTYYYYVQVNNACAPLKSSIATVVVKAASTIPTSVSASNNNFCAGVATNLTVIGGALGDGANWKWYRGSCGGAFIGSGTSINVSPLITTSYFVRAEGDCNTTNCVSINVIVNSIAATVTSPLSTVVTYGNNANFIVLASGPNYTYQWQEYAGYAWANITNGVKYSNTNNSSLNVLLPTVGITGYQYRCIVSGDCGMPVTSGIATLTVNPASTNSIFKLSAGSVPNKDYLTLTDTIKPLNILSVLTGLVNFTINGNNYGLVNAVPIPGDTEGKLVAMLIVQINEMPGGPYTASATFASTNSNYLGSNASQKLLVTPRGTSPYLGTAVFYTEQVFAWSTNICPNTATALLSAEVKDNSFPKGDVRAARVTFYYVFPTGVLLPIPGATNLTVGLVNLSDGSLGTASTTVKLDLNSLNFANYKIAVGIGGAYTDNFQYSNAQVIVTVSKPIGKGYISGKSQIANNNKSAGLIQGAATAKTDYWFTVQYNKYGTDFKGQVWFKVRSYYKTNGTLDNKLHTYQVNSNAITTFNTIIQKGTGIATFTSKATLAEVLPNGTVISIEGNNNLQLVASQNGCTQQIAITLFKKAGGIWFANNWSGTGAVLQQVNLGSTVFVEGANNLCGASSPFTTDSATKIISPYDTNPPPYQNENKVWPNPSKTSFNLLIDGNNKTVAEIRIFDISGRQFDFMRAAPGALVKFGDNYRPGMYIIKILEGRDEKVIKVIKE